jgi:hypothetical protein
VAEIVLTSALPPDECADRLRAATDQDGGMFISGCKPVLGRVSGRSVRLRKRPLGRSDFRACLIGILEPQGDGTVFRGTVGLNPSTWYFMAVWFGGAVFACFIGLMDAVRTAVAGATPRPMGVVIPLAMLGFGVMLLRAGRNQTRAEEPFLVAFLAGTIRPVAVGKEIG